MKTKILTLLFFLALPILALSQVADDFAALPATVPQDWVAGFSKWGFVAMLVGRAFAALRNGGGLIGVWRGILFGTNTPKSPPAK